MKIEKDFYQTSDLNIASVLLCQGFGISGINPVNPDRVFFYFDLDKHPTINKIVENYWSGRLKVNPKEFVSNRRELLSRIHESKRQMEE